MKGLVSKETAELCQQGSQTRKFGKEITTFSLDLR